MREMCELALAGDVEGAKRVDETLREMHDVLFCESNPIPAKWALAEMGLIGGTLRLPLSPLSPQFHDRVRRAMNTAQSVVASEV